jgi:SAM-dependent methyltransferase
VSEDYLNRVRERLASGKLLDAAFDCLLPPAVRMKSPLHWTPVSVARLAAVRLAEHGARRILDAGSGPGKFCTVGASTCSLATFVGIEQRVGLVAVARHLAERLGLTNARFVLGDAMAHSWARFDGFYFFNPFAENALGAEDVFDAGTSAPKLRFATEALRVARRLREARLGSTLVTYHGLGGPIPSSYEIVSEENPGSGCLRTWVKKRDREEGWVHVEHRGVSRAPWDMLQRDSLRGVLRKTNSSRRHVALQGSGADLEPGSRSDGAALLRLQSGLDDLTSEKLEPVV